MICPSKACKAEIPEDSCYCDQCGLQLLICDKCGNIGISKRCGKCGGYMLTLPVTPSSPSISDSSETPVTSTVNSPSSASSATPTQSVVVGGTMILSEEKSYELIHSEGWSLSLTNGNIIGRVTGNYVSQLGRFATISSRHAQVTNNNGCWSIIDLGSTNGTFINGNRITPNTPVEFKENDTVVFADISFTVRTK